MVRQEGFGGPVWWPTAVAPRSAHVRRGSSGPLRGDPAGFHGALRRGPPWKPCPGCPTARWTGAACRPPSRRRPWTAEGPRRASRRRRGTDETQLAELWEELWAAAPRPPSEDNFFELGGHSLLAARLVARLRQDLRRRGEPSAEIFEVPSLGGQLRAHSGGHGIWAEPQACRRPSSCAAPRCRNRRTNGPRRCGLLSPRSGSGSCSRWSRRAPPTTRRRWPASPGELSVPRGLGGRPCEELVKLATRS